MIICELCNRSLKICNSILKKRTNLGKSNNFNSPIPKKQKWKKLNTNKATLIPIAG